MKQNCILPYGFVICIPGKPIPWHRVGGLIHRYDTQKAEKLAIGLLFRKLLGNTPPYKGPCHLEIKFYFKPPKKFKPSSPYALDYYMPHRPDKDNLEKFIYDTMTQANVWLDDCQVVDSHVQKRYLNYNYDKEPYTEIIFQDLSLLDQYVQGDSYESNKRRHQ